MSNLFFINTAKWKMKIKSVFNVLGKQKTKFTLNSIFLCHWKTVGTKVHEFLRLRHDHFWYYKHSSLLLSNDQKNSPFLLIMILQKKKLKRIKTLYPYWHFLQFQSPLKRWSVKLTVNPAMYVSHMKYTALNLKSQ